MQILFIQTGGTIDKDYPKSIGGWAFEFGEPATGRILEKLKPNFEYKMITAFQKDSQEITVEDRSQLSDLISAEGADKIIITHGTDTLLDTALYLGERHPDKVIIITGAMRPERFTNSDAPVNIGMALAVAQLKDKGTWVCIQGLVKSYDQMQRNMESGQFY